MIRVLVVNEFSDVGCPITRMVYDFGAYAKESQHWDIAQINCRTDYRPGGTRPVRILSLLALHLVLPWIFAWQRVLGILSRKKIVALVTTLPPFIHWNALVWGFLFRIPIVVWYQDAHPEIENRILEKRHFGVIAKVLRAIDCCILKLATSLVTLDDGMRSLLTKELRVLTERIQVAYPWITYVEPALPLRGELVGDGEIKLLYAGNYGYAHDVSSFAKQLAALPAEIKTRIKITAVGMNEHARTVFCEIFRTCGIAVTSLPRFNRFEDLLAVFGKHHFGLTSLREDYAGIACPSKAFTYISQGLPVLYTGPSNTLSSELVENGFGVDVSKFIDWLTADQKKIRLTAAGKTLQNPRPIGLQILAREITRAAQA